MSTTHYGSAGFNSHKGDPHADDPIVDRDEDEIDPDDGYDLTADEVYVGMWPDGEA